ncbi:MAG: site-specific DNA-methyltransferase [Gemmatimonadetes bacterium]|nr:site-specific DNA-methyltransferase [Gemmatimonadota bacterium]
MDDVENETASRVEQYLSKIKVIRRIASAIIDFLAQLEDFQKKLWLKKKFVVQTEYCTTLGHIPDSLAAKVAATEAIRRSWETYDHTDATESNLPVDTALLPPRLKDQVIDSIDHTTITGTLIVGDNRAGLSLAQPFLRGRTRMIYMDPPFNTGNDGFAYKNNYMHSSWLAMMDDRIGLLTSALANDGTLYAHIDYEEKERLKLLLDQRLCYITEIIWRIGWLSGYKTKASKFIRNHDTIYQYAKTEKPFFQKTYIPYPPGYVRRDGSAPKGAGYPIEDTWNCTQLDSMNSIQIVSFSKEKVGDDSLTQKNENLVKRMMIASSEKGDLVVDPFLGSGTTAAVAMKLRRDWVCCEIMDRALRSALPRLRRVVLGDPYGISRDDDVQWSGGAGFRYVVIESYEDTLANLQVRRSARQQQLLDDPEAHGADGLKEQYILRYMLDVETRGSQSLLNVQAFTDPTAYTLRVKRPGSDESRNVNVDLLETFNWLIGLNVRHIAAPKAFSAAVERDGQKRLRLKGRLRQEPDGPYWFRTVTGTTPDGRETLVIWRKLSGDPERDNLLLNEWFNRHGYSAKDRDFDLIYVNGGNNIENLKTPDDLWKVRLIEEDFHRLMFDTEGQ